MGQRTPPSSTRTRLVGASQDTRTLRTRSQQGHAGAILARILMPRKYSMRQAICPVTILLSALVSRMTLLSELLKIITFIYLFIYLLINQSIKSIS